MRHFLKIIFVISFSFSGCALQNRNNAFFQPQQYPAQKQIVYDVGFSSTPMPDTHDECSSKYWSESNRLQTMVNQGTGDRSIIQPLQQKAFDWEYACHQKINAAKEEAKAKRALEKSKQPKIARVPTLKNYDLPKSLGLPNIFPAKWQDCTLYFQDAGERLHYMIQIGESEVSRNMFRNGYDKESRANSANFSINAVQAQTELVRWYTDCRNQSDNIDE
jgi:hypothetical protein